MDKLTNFYKYFWNFMDKLRNSTFGKFLKRLWKTSLLQFFYYRSIFLSIVWATMFSWFSICFVKIFKKPSASCFIFSGLHKPKKHQVYYSWIIRLISLSVLLINDKFRNINNSRSGNHVNIVSWELRAVFRTHSKYRFTLFYGLHEYELGQSILHRR